MLYKLCINLIDFHYLCEICFRKSRKREDTRKTEDKTNTFDLTNVNQGKLISYIQYTVLSLIFVDYQFSWILLLS